MLCTKVNAAKLCTVFTFPFQFIEIPYKWPNCVKNTSQNIQNQLTAVIWSAEIWSAVIWSAVTWEVNMLEQMTPDLTHAESSNQKVHVFWSSFIETAFLQGTNIVIIIMEMMSVTSELDYKSELHYLTTNIWSISHIAKPYKYMIIILLIISAAVVKFLVVQINTNFLSFVHTNVVIEIWKVFLFSILGINYMHKFKV